MAKRFPLFSAFALLAVSATAPAIADQMARQADPYRASFDGVAFACQNGSELLLDFQSDGRALLANVQVLGASYRLPIQPSEPGLAQITWSDGARTLTWSPGVQIMWMSASTHLMCGRGGHKH
jgi:hypothetical protein